MLIVCWMCTRSSPATRHTLGYRLTCAASLQANQWRAETRSRRRNRLSARDRPMAKRSGFYLPLLDLTDSFELFFWGPYGYQMLWGLGCEDKWMKVKFPRSAISLSFLWMFFLDMDSLKLRGENLINNIRNGRSHLPVLESDLDLFVLLFGRPLRPTNCWFSWWKKTTFLYIFLELCYE